MRKAIIIAALALLSPAVKAGDAQPPDLPAVKEDVPGQAPESDVSRPDSQKILAGLTAELRLSAKQEAHISSAIDARSKSFDKLLKDYDKASAEETTWRNKVNDLKRQMVKINKELPDAIRDFLDDDQRQSYDALRAARNKPAPGIDRPAAAPEAAAQAGPAAAPTHKLVKRRKLVKRKKNRAGGRSAEALTEAPAAPPAAAGEAEEDSGQVMVDKEPAAAKPPRTASGTGKKRVLRKKTAHAARTAPPAKEAAPAEDIMANEPADSDTAGKEAPAKAEEDAGSYP